MEKIENGEFVRTVNGEIGKIRVIIDNMIFINNNQYYHDSSKIVKHSRDVIDLIEVGDFVNGRKIERVNDYGEHKRADFNLDFDDCDAVYNEDIETILTKEQYNQNCYRLEE